MSRRDTLVMIYMLGGIVADVVNQDNETHSYPEKILPRAAAWADKVMAAWPGDAGG